MKKLLVYLIVVYTIVCFSFGCGYNFRELSIGGKEKVIEAKSDHLSELLKKKFNQKEIKVIISTIDLVKNLDSTQIKFIKLYNIDRDNYYLDFVSNETYFKKTYNISDNEYRKLSLELKKENKYNYQFNDSLNQVVIENNKDQYLASKYNFIDMFYPLLDSNAFIQYVEILVDGAELLKITNPKGKLYSSSYIYEIIKTQPRFCIVPNYFIKIDCYYYYENEYSKVIYLPFYDNNNLLFLMSVSIGKLY